MNGFRSYTLPDDGTEAGHCAYTYPVIPLEVAHLVNGINAFQFACSRGTSFWGHYIVDNAVVRCYLESGHADLAAMGLDQFSAEIRTGHGQVLLDEAEITLKCDSRYHGLIESVSYIGNYYGYDDR